MAIQNSTLELLNYQNDIEIDFNIKIIILCLLFIISAVMLYLTFKMKDDTLWEQIVKYSMRIFSSINIFFSPLLPIFLYREVSAGILLNYIWIEYSVIFTITIMLMHFKIFTFFLKMFGWEPKRAKLRYLKSD